MKNIITFFLSILLMFTLIVPANADFSYDYVVLNYPPIVMSVENCTSFVTLRKEPKATSEEMAKIQLKETVCYLSSAENGFYKVSYNGNTGYVLSQYLGYAWVTADDTESDLKNAAIPYTVVDCKEFITMRDRFDGQGADILKIPLGAIVDYCQDAKDGYCEVVYRGHRGYVLKKYLEPVKTKDDSDYFRFRIIAANYLSNTSIAMGNSTQSNRKAIVFFHDNAITDWIIFAEDANGHIGSIRHAGSVPTTILEEYRFNYQNGELVAISTSSYIIPTRALKKDEIWNVREVGKVKTDSIVYTNGQLYLNIQHESTTAGVALTISDNGQMITPSIFMLDYGTDSYTCHANFYIYYDNAPTQEHYTYRNNDGLNCQALFQGKQLVQLTVTDEHGTPIEDTFKRTSGLVALSNVFSDLALLP